MKYFVPTYYSEFHCIADKCKHSCCKGWEIDVDSDTLKKYQKIDGELGEELRKNIEMDESGAHMILQGEEEKCPFLNEKGLCRLILAKGEDILCNICTDHPRYRVFRTNITEEGIGVACEEACRIILSQEGAFTLELQADDGADEEEDPLEVEVFAERDNWITYVQRTDLNLSEKITEILGETCYDRYDIFSQLEYMNSEFRDNLLNTIDQDINEILNGEYEKSFENLLVYLIFRHPWEGARVCTEVALCAIRIFSSKETGTFEELVEIVRELSSELEYSDENLGIIAEII